MLSPNLDLAFVLSSSRQVVGKLHTQPRFRRAAKRLGEPDRHLRADGGLAVHHVVEGLPGDAKNLGAFRHGQAQRFKASGPYAPSGMRRVFQCLSFRGAQGRGSTN